MKYLPDRSLRGAVAVSLVVVLCTWAVHGQRGNKGPGAPPPTSPHSLPTPSAIAGSSGVLLAGIQPYPFGGGPGGGTGPDQATNGYLMSTSPFATTLALFKFFDGALLSGLTQMPPVGSLFFSFSGGFTDGGSIYHYPPGGPFILAGPGALGQFAMAGLAYDSTGALWASGDVFILNDGLYSVDVFTGVATLVGGYGAVCGVDGIAEDPTTGTLYGFTGFCYDGSPGDVIIIDRLTGVGVDIGIDLTDASGALPPCSVVGASFAPDGTGYASIGCQYGLVLKFQTVGATPFLFEVLGNAFVGAGLAGGSLTDVEVLF